MSAIRGLLFDKDGTLFDFSATWGGWTRRLVIELAGGTPDRAADLARVLGFDTDTGRFQPDSAVIAHTTGEIAALLLPRLPGWQIGPLIQRLNEMAAENEMAPTVPLGPLFRRFADLGLKVGLATNDAEEPARQHLRGAGIEDYFDFVSGFDSGWGGKPGTGQLEAFLDLTGLAPGEVAMVGDSLHDLHAGRDAGMRTVAVLTGIAGAPDLDPHADVVLTDIGMLPDWVLAQAGPRA